LKVYIVYDKRTGEILHKHRLVSLRQGETEDTLVCDPEQVLSSYRGDRPREHLGVAQLNDYQPRTSRGRTARYDHAKARMVDQMAGAGAEAVRDAPRRPGARSGKE
jgi:hypothetical protein